MIGGKPVFYRECFSKGIISIEQLLSENSKFMTFTDFQLKYRCKTNFLQFYQMISVIPSHLLTIAQQRISSLPSIYTDSSTMFLLDPTTHVDSSKLKANNIYQLLNNKIHTVDQTGTQKWNKSIPTNNNEWAQLFKSIPKLCKEPKLREFHFKPLHRIVVTRKDLCKYRIKPDSDCIYCGEGDSLEHTFMNCSFRKTFFVRILDWVNEEYQCTFVPSEKEMLFGINGNTKAVRRLNFTLLFMKYYIYGRN